MSEHSNDEILKTKYYEIAGNLGKLAVLEVTFKLPINQNTILVI